MNYRVIVQVIFILLMPFLLSGCSKKYIQIFDTNAARTPNINDQWVFDNDTVAIHYSFWAAGGVISFAVYNKTDRQLFIDWKNSAFILNDQKLDYWIDQTRLSSSGVSASSSASWINSGAFDWGYVLRTNTVSSYASQGSIVREERITSLPPHAYVGANKYRLREDLWKFKDPNVPRVEVPRNDGKGKTVVTEEIFEQNDSPLRFRNYLALSFSDNGENPFHVDNGFWVSKIREMDYRHYQGSVVGKDERGLRIYSKPDKKRTAFYWKYSE